VLTVQELTQSADRQFQLSTTRSVHNVSCNPLTCRSGWRKGTRCPSALPTMISRSGSHSLYELTGQPTSSEAAWDENRTEWWLPFLHELCLRITNKIKLEARHAIGSYVVSYKQTRVTTQFGKSWESSRHPELFPLSTSLISYRKMVLPHSLTGRWEQYQVAAVFHNGIYSNYKLTNVNSISLRCLPQGGGREVWEQCFNEC